MGQETPQQPISKQRVMYTVPGMEAVTVRRDETYRVTDRGALTMDLYYPSDAASGARRPAVVFVTGFSDAGAQKMIGCTFKEMGSFVSWAQLMAASGLVGVTYTNSEPATDVHAVLRHLRQNAAALGVDADRMGVWTCSGHAPTALSVLMENADGCLKCAAVCYGYTLDAAGAHGVAYAARQFGFVIPCAGRSVDDLPRDIPLFIVRAGQDRMPGLNDALDRFVAGALTCNLAVTLVNHSTAPHAFDLFSDSETSREIIRQILGFMQRHLAPFDP